MVNRSTRRLTSGAMTRQLTEIAHELIAEHVHAGDSVIDATMGNGHDTLFLAGRVGEQGHVYAFDIQQQALDMTSARLGEHGLRDRATLLHENHADMCRCLPAGLEAHVAAVVFNLGYLPGGEKSLTTRSDSTLQALDQSLELLQPGGILSVMAYVGHPGGQEENRAILEWMGALEDASSWQQFNRDCTPHSPRLYRVLKSC